MTNLSGVYNGSTRLVGNINGTIDNLGKLLNNNPPTLSPACLQALGYLLNELQSILSQIGNLQNQMTQIGQALQNYNCGLAYFIGDNYYQVAAQIAAIQAQLANLQAEYDDILAQIASVLAACKGGTTPFVSCPQGNRMGPLGVRRICKTGALGGSGPAGGGIPGSGPPGQPLAPPLGSGPPAQPPSPPGGP